MLLNLGNILAEDPSRTDDALKTYRMAIASGSLHAVANAGILMAELERVDEARILLAQAAAEGDDLAAEALESLGHRDAVPPGSAEETDPDRM